MSMKPTLCDDCGKPTGGQTDGPTAGYLCVACAGARFASTPIVEKTLDERVKDLETVNAAALAALNGGK